VRPFLLGIDWHVCSQRALATGPNLDLCPGWFGISISWCEFLAPRLEDDPAKTGHLSDAVADESFLDHVVQRLGIGPFAQAELFQHGFDIVVEGQ
jgi:hypothetical protein